jgi:poly(3-hydroxybutyrate) depolymerase
MARVADYPFAALGLLWPAIMAEQASEFAAAVAHGLIDLAGEPEGETHGAEPAWVTPNEVVLELESVRLRGFCKSAKGQPILVCAPFALHGATLTDIAPGYSLVSALRATTDSPIFVTDWRSAGAHMASRTVDDYVADLNVIVDELGGSVDLVGLCQGGWMGLVYAARFPRKARKLVFAGAPIDISAGDCALSRLAQSTPIDVFKELVSLGGGRMLGRRLFRFWEPNALDVEEVRSTLQSTEAIDAEALQRLEARFREWYAWTMDLPGRYYLEVVERLYLKNELATGRFTALGRPIDLAAVTAPIYLLAARDDQVVAPAQTLGLARLVGTRPDAIHRAVAPGNHLGVFMGRRTLANEWREIGRWLAHRDPALSDAA